MSHISVLCVNFTSTAIRAVFAIQLVSGRISSHREKEIWQQYKLRSGLSHFCVKRTRCVWMLLHSACAQLSC
eukprot:scaffold148872_cov14-Tisochrysis_lutea.AAC.1